MENIIEIIAKEINITKHSLEVLKDDKDNQLYLTGKLNAYEDILNKISK
jgi:hypothetical protein